MGLSNIQRFVRSSALVAAVLSLSFASNAQDKSAKSTPINSITNAPITEVSPGIFQIGEVRLDKAAKSISFQASLNMNDGLIEYLLVHNTGKTHESLLKTETQPFHIQIAMLLLGAKGAKLDPLLAEPAGGPINGTQLATEGNRPIPGDPVEVRVEWHDKDKAKSCAIEDLVLNVQTKAPMTRGNFVFNGSRVWNGTFIAQRDGSIISTITDFDAVFNNPRPGHDHDDNWQIIRKDLPPLGTPVQVIITCKPAANPVAQPKQN